MKHSLLFAVAVAGALTVQASGQINGAGAAGYLERGSRMFDDLNYTGCIDQMRAMERLTPSPGQMEEARRLTALSALYLGHDDALRLLQRWIADYPASARREEMLAAVGDWYFHRSDYPAAVEAYGRVDRDALDSYVAADVDYRQAYSRLMLGDTEEAMQGFSRLARSDRYRAAGAFYRGYLEYAAGNYAAARTLFKEAAGNAELNDVAQYYLAQIDFVQGDFSGALSLSRQLLKNDAVEQFAPEMNRIAGESLFNLGREEEALPYLRRYASTTDRIRPSAFYILGVGEYRLGNYQAAIRSLGHAAASDNAMGQSANLILGQSYLAEGKAIRQFRGAVRELPARVSAVGICRSSALLHDIGIYDRQRLSVGTEADRCDEPSDAGGQCRPPARALRSRHPRIFVGTPDRGSRPFSPGRFHQRSRPLHSQAVSPVGGNMPVRPRTLRCRSALP